MKRNACASLLLFSVALVAGCGLPETEGLPRPATPSARELGQRQQGLTTLFKGRVSSLGYLKTGIVVAGFDFPGCRFQLDTVPGTNFDVLLNMTDTDAMAAEGMCRMAFDALKSGAEVQVDAPAGESVRSVTMTR